MQKYHFSPSPLLAPYIERYWSGEGTAEEALRLPKLLPGTGAELFLHYRTPFRVISAVGQGHAVPRMHVLSLRHTSLQLAPTADVGFIAVRFRAGALRHFCPRPMVGVIDRVTPLEELLPALPSPFTTALDAELPMRQRVAVVEAGLLRLLQRFQQPDRRIDAAVQAVYAAGRHPAAMAAAGPGPDVSSRQLRRWFQTAVGVSPKQFHSLARFQHTVRHLLLHQQTAYLPTAMAHGYFDQAHFVHDFRRLAGETPGRFLREHNLMSHFYNTSASV